MDKAIQVLDSNTTFENYFSENSISSDTQCKLLSTDFLIVPAKHGGNEFYFAQEAVSFVKFCRQNDQDHTYDLLADGDIQIRSLHSFDIWMPVVWVASSVLLPFAINMVSSYIYDKLRGRENEEAKVDVTFIVKLDQEEKTIHYSGDAKTFKESFEKIDLNTM